ncbi:putative plastid-lipid-associated protein 13, chloroplastic [Hordeum vulgare]|nr:putative plastid-lipid-associated protein 13, chloroplastic [Hordeum vulgare]
MERLSAKESLLLAVSLPVSRSPCSRNECPWPAPYWSIRTFRDSGGFESFVGGKTTEMQKIDVDERIVGLERLNPTPRPTTCPACRNYKVFAQVKYKAKCEAMKRINKE